MTYIIMDVIIGVGDVVESSTVGRLVCAFFFSLVFFAFSLCVCESLWFVHNALFFSCRRSLLSTLITGVTRFIDVCAINTDTMANIRRKGKKKSEKVE